MALIYLSVLYGKDITDLTDHAAVDTFQNVLWVGQDRFQKNVLLKDQSLLTVATTKKKVFKKLKKGAPRKAAVELNEI